MLGFWRLRQTANERRYIGAVVRPVFPLHMSVGFGRQWLKNANQCLNFRFPCLTASEYSVESLENQLEITLTELVSLQSAFTQLRKKRIDI